MIKRFNESLDDDLEHDVKYILIDLIDMGFQFKLNKKFFSSDGYSSYDDVKPDHRIPGFTIELSLNNTEVTSDLILNATKPLSECCDRLSEYGDVVIKLFSFNGSKSHESDKAQIVIYVIEIDKSEELSDKEGFYDFYEAIRRAFKVAFNNKVTRAFDFEQTKEGVILKAKEGVDSKQILPETRRFINNFFIQKVRYLHRPNWHYKYEIKLVDNDIQVNYLGRTNN
jgi:hypothetical protein